MGKKRRIALAALAVVMLGALVWVVMPSGPPEPVYEGKTAREWISRLQPGSQADLQHSDASTAIRQMGTNAVPALVEIIRAEDSAWIIRVKSWLERIGFSGAHSQPASSLHWHGVWGLSLLGTNGQCAVPALVRAYDESVSPETKLCALVAIKSVDRESKNSVPFLLRALTATNADVAVRTELVSVIGYIGEPGQTVPALTAALSDSAAEVRAHAASLLGNFGTNARTAVPALRLAATKDSDAKVRIYASNALVNIDPEAAAKAGVK